MELNRAERSRFSNILLRSQTLMWVIVNCINTWRAC